MKTIKNLVQLMLGSIKNAECFAIAGCNNRVITIKNERPSLLVSGKQLLLAGKKVEGDMEAQAVARLNKEAQAVALKARQDILAEVYAAETAQIYAAYGVQFALGAPPGCRWMM